MFTRSSILVLSLAILAGCEGVSPTAPISDFAPAPESASSLGPATIFGGLSHFAEGGALLQRSGEDLTILNIGSSGLDGVCIDPGQAEGLHSVFEPVALDEIGFEWTSRSRKPGDLSISIAFEPRAGLIAVMPSTVGTDPVTLEVGVVGTQIHSEQFPYPPLGEMFLSPGAVLTESIVGSNGELTLHFAAPVTFLCPNGVGIEGDAIRFDFSTVTGPVFPGAWETAYRFRRMPGSTTNGVTIESSALVLGDLSLSAHDGTRATAVAGALVRLSGQGEAGVRSNMLGDDAYEPVMLRGVNLRQPGDAFRIEIGGLGTANKSGSQSLVINLSLGWTPDGLRVAGDYPTGCGSALTYARCQGALVFAATVEPGQAVLALPASDGFAGFVPERVGVDESSGRIVVEGSALRADGSKQSTRLVLRPQYGCGMSSATVGYVYDAAGNRAVRWSIGPASALPTIDEPSLPTPTSR